MSISGQCNKQAVLPGGFYYTIRKARDNYNCFYCTLTIRKGTLYVEEKFASLTRRFHIKCFNRIIPHRLTAVDTPSGASLCKI